MPAERALETADGGAGSTRAPAPLRGPAANRHSARTPNPASQPSCVCKLTPLFTFSTSKPRILHFHCSFALLRYQHEFCIMAPLNLFPQLAGIANPVSRPAMSLRGTWQPAPRGGTTSQGRLLGASVLGGCRQRSPLVPSRPILTADGRAVATLASPPQNLNRLQGLNLYGKRVLA